LPFNGVVFMMICLSWLGVSKAKYGRRQWSTVAADGESEIQLLV
jgi:hypothetical protein